MDNTISIKGTREGLTITLGDGDLSVLLSDLSQHLEMQGAFFRGGRVALQVGRRDMTEEQLAAIEQILREHEMVFRTVVGDSTITRSAATALGLRLVEAEPTADAEPLRPTAAQVVQPFEESKGILVRRVVRSGQIVRHTGHVVVVGDVNIGAEVIAGGDIIVWGRLFGKAYAGAMNNERAVVCALEMRPLQLRIGNLIARPDESDRTGGTGPEIAHVRDNAILVVPWNRAPRGVL